MQKVLGKLVNDVIIVSKPKDVGRLYSKSRFGITNKDNNLILNFIEGLFLLEEEKIKIFDENKEINFDYLLKKSLSKISNFELKYLVFKDLRKKGYLIKSYDNKNFDFIINNKNTINGNKKNYFVSIFSEKNILKIDKIKKLIDQTDKKNGILWFSIVDEEGDITYYEVTIEKMKGENLEKNYLKISSILMQNRVIILDKKNGKKLFQEEFYGKPFGIGFQLSLIEALYLLNRDFLEIHQTDNGKKFDFKSFKNYVKNREPDIDLRFDIYKDLKNRGFILKTGFKFGTHFRAYSKKPDLIHAEYLVHVIPKNYESIWSDFSRAIRLAHSVNKEIIFAIPQLKKNEIVYIKIGRLRP